MMYVFFNDVVYPVVNVGSDQRSELGVFIFLRNVSYSIGEPRSYLEFPNHLIIEISIANGC